MNIQLHKSTTNQESTIKITGSKSESNRLLLLQALYSNIEIENLSNSDDTLVMKEALSTSSNSIDVHHAGTAMRFLSAYFVSLKHRNVVLTNANRMKERPIQILVKAHKTHGADISYLETQRFPPQKLNRKSLTNITVTNKENLVSQVSRADIFIT